MAWRFEDRERMDGRNVRIDRRHYYPFALCFSFLSIDIDLYAVLSLLLSSIRKVLQLLRKDRVSYSLHQRHCSCVHTVHYHSSPSVFAVLSRHEAPYFAVAHVPRVETATNKAEMVENQPTPIRSMTGSTTAVPAAAKVYRII